MSLQRAGKNVKTSISVKMFPVCNLNFCSTCKRDHPEQCGENDFRENGH
jgi:hypothetical protein